MTIEEREKAVAEGKRILKSRTLQKIKGKEISDIEILNICQVPKSMYTITWNKDQILDRLVEDGSIVGLKVKFGDDVEIG